LSVLKNGDDARLYSCESIRVRDAASNHHVVCAGIDLGPALEAQGVDPEEIIADIFAACQAGGGSANVPASAAKSIRSVANILNIEWVGRGLEREATIICPRSANCPRDPCCVTKPKKNRPITEDIRRAIVAGDA
jgi:hypothetical protein